MADPIHKITKWTDHNRYTAAGAVIALAMMAFGVACQPKARSPLTGLPVTRTELVADTESALADIQAQFAALQAKSKSIQAVSDASFDEIERQEAVIQKTIGVLSGLATQFAGPAGGMILSTALGIGGMAVGLGVGVDNRRKDKIIKSNGN